MVYNYTKPRGPVAAMFTGPGPCYTKPPLVGYNHHDTTSTHTREPMWSFGLRHGKDTDDCSPGPCYLPTQKYYHTGKDGTPHYSLSSRHAFAKPSLIPGPGAYAVHGAYKHIYPSQNGCSISFRHKAFRGDETPGPNKYTLDPMLGKTVRSGKASAPAPSLSSRTKEFGLSESPGAGTYKVVSLDLYKSAPPKYSLRTKHQPLTESTHIPGPGAYFSENVNVHKQSAPRFSFGIRYSPYKGEFLSDTEF